MRMFFGFILAFILVFCPDISWAKCKKEVITKEAITGTILRNVYGKNCNAYFDIKFDDGEMDSWSLYVCDEDFVDSKGYNFLFSEDIVGERVEIEYNMSNSYGPHCEPVSYITSVKRAGH